MIYHIWAFALGIVLDCLIGDPIGAPHPIRFIGNLISRLEKKFNSPIKSEALRGGRILVASVLGIVAAVSAVILLIPYSINVYFGVAVEAVLTYYILAARSLYEESMKVYWHLGAGKLERARRAVSMIVGRDTASLSDIGITKAAVETVAENTSDGVIAPMIFTAIGGPVLGFVYKAVNTMDSMVGYKNKRFINFGRAAAKLDDILNFIPSRISAFLMIAACLFLGKDFDAEGAYKIFRRDSRKHASPNSAQTESVCAGALGIQLAGDASYFGEVHKKPFIGDALRSVEYEDIRRANVLMYAATTLCAVLCITIMFVTSFSK